MPRTSAEKEGPAPVVFGLGVRWWYNSRAVQGIRLLDMVDINDIEGVRYVCKWDEE